MFLQTFLRKNRMIPHGLLPPVRSHPPWKSGLWQFPSAAPHFRRKQAPELPFSVTPPSRENGIAERPQTLRYPEIKNKFSADNG